MSLQIGVRHFYQALSLVLVGLVVAVGIHQLEFLHHLFFGTKLTIYQTLPSAVFAFLSFALVLPKRPKPWPRPVELVAVVLLLVLAIASAYLLIAGLGPRDARATWPNYYTGLRAFACLIALATLLASSSTMLAQVPANVYRACAVVVMIAGAAIDIKIADMVQRGGFYAFMGSYIYLLTLGILILLWTEARLPRGSRVPAIVGLGMVAALFSGGASVALGVYYANHARGDDFWTFLFGFLPTMAAALCMLVASRSVDSTMPSVRQFGRVVGLSIILLQICVARWFAYVFFPGGIDQSWRFLQFASNLVPLGLLLLVQFEVFSGEDDASAVAAVPGVPPIPSTAVSR